MTIAIGDLTDVTMGCKGTSSIVSTTHVGAELTGGRARATVEGAVEAAGGAEPAGKGDVEDRLVALGKPVEVPGQPIAQQIFVDGNPEDAAEGVLRGARMNVGEFADALEAQRLAEIGVEAARSKYVSGCR